MRTMYICGLLALLSLGSCSESGHRKRRHQKEKETSGSSSSSSVIQMQKEGGVYTLPVEVNGLKMRMIFDTGASEVTMSQKEAKELMNQGLLTEEDIVGAQQYAIADGSIVEGTRINLRTVKIGNKEVHNIAASVMPNQEAPLLLGQSVLSKFGTISVNYDKQQLTLR